jgi:hypothetical protein
MANCHGGPTVSALSGEVGQRFGKEFLATGKFDVPTYDILFDNSPEGAALRDKARAAGRGLRLGGGRD